MDLHLARVEKRLPFPRKVLELGFLVTEEAYLSIELLEIDAGYPDIYSVLVTVYSLRLYQVYSQSGFLPYNNQVTRAFLRLP